MSQNVRLSVAAITFVIIYWIWYEKISITLIVYATGVAFALLHLQTEYWIKDTWLLLSGYLGLGLILSWLRLRFGMIYSILFHILWNGFAVTLPNIGYFPVHSHSSFYHDDDNDTVSVTQQSIFEMYPLQGSFHLIIAKF